MEEPLDDVYALEKNHHQVAYNGLMDTGKVKEELIWTGQPPMLDSPKGIFFRIWISTLMLLGYTIYENGFIAIEMFFMLLFMVIFMVLISVLEYWHQKRQIDHTFYGISATKIWVKRYKQPLESYSIVDLPTLKEKEIGIYYVTIKNSTYKEHFIFPGIPDHSNILQLLQRLQVENKGRV